MSVTESVSDFREPYMMKENNYDNTNEIIRTLENTTDIVSEDEIKVMNLKWKNSTMISFSTWGKKLLHDFLSWNLWVKVALNESIVEKYGVFIQKTYSRWKTYLFDDLYTEFSKFKLTRFYSTKSKTLYRNKSFSKDSVDEMIKAVMTRK